jgi:murein DD-endopeptidase MepM/ murein hydrolase activator NlpD
MRRTESSKGGFRLVKSRRYTVVLADRTTGVVRRFTISLKPTLAILATLLSLPVLVGLGLRWSAVAEISALRAQTATLLVENNSYRAATKELTDQVVAVQGFVDQLSADAKLDPNSAKALSKLPASVRAGAMGGGGTDVSTPIARSVLSPALASPDDTFGPLREWLGRLGGRLQMVKNDVEKRAALVAATPSIWPAYGPLSAAFGQRDDPISGGRATHTGIDISSDKGRPVRASAAGKVESTGWNGDYGKMVVIDHGFGIVTRYAHLADFAVQPGATVERDQVIGYVGTTGRTTGPHLHYEVLVNGQLTDPLRFLTDMRR